MPSSSSQHRDGGVSSIVCFLVLWHFSCWLFLLVLAQTRLWSDSCFSPYQGLTLWSIS